VLAFCACVLFALNGWLFGLVWSGVGGWGGGGLFIVFLIRLVTWEW
jgi:hypothetical protein